VFILGAMYLVLAGVSTTAPTDISSPLRSVSRCADMPGGGRTGADVSWIIARGMSCRSVRTLIGSMVATEPCYVGDGCRVEEFVCSSERQDREEEAFDVVTVRCTARGRSFVAIERAELHLL